MLNVPQSERPRLTSIRESLTLARECFNHDYIEFSETTCQNGHDVGLTNLQTDTRFANKNFAKCINCQRKIHATGTDDFIACDKKCKYVYCMGCLGCPSGHILCFARNKRSKNVSQLSRRKCHRCQKDLTFVECFMHCKADNFSFCIERCVPY